MNIIEAVKSGKRFKRKSWDGPWCTKDDVSALSLQSWEILADDWEVEEKKVEITAEILRAHMLECQQDRRFSQWAFQTLARSLGLIE